MVYFLKVYGLCPVPLSHFHLYLKCYWDHHSQDYRVFLWYASYSLVFLLPYCGLSVLKVSRLSPQSPSPWPNLRSKDPQVQVSILMTYSSCQCNRTYQQGFMHALCPGIYWCVSHSVPLNSPHIHDSRNAGLQLKSKEIPICSALYLILCGFSALKRDCCHCLSNNALLSTCKAGLVPNEC